MSDRLQKVSQAIKEEVAQILQRELKDPRMGFVTLTRVEVSPDLNHATVYYSHLEEKGKVDTEAALKSGVSYIRKLLGNRLRIRVTPQLHFRPDPSVSESIRISKLLDNLKKE